MPKSKKSARKPPSHKPPLSMDDTQPEQFSPHPEPVVSSSAWSSVFSLRNIVLLLLILGLGIAWKYRSQLIVATINGQPITRFELNNYLMTRFGQQALDTLINERLILGETRQRGIFVTVDEINNQTKTIESRLQGTPLSDALSAQGMTMDLFRKQIEIQLAIEKMFDKEASISSTEIEEYIKKNAAAYKNATDPAKLREEVTESLKQQKINEAFDRWFEEVKKNATVQKYV